MCRAVDLARTSGTRRAAQQQELGAPRELTVSVSVIRWRQSAARLQRVDFRETHWRHPKDQRAEAFGGQVEIRRMLLGRRDTRGRGVA
jgi:hypothetical protein